VPPGEDNCTFCSPGRGKSLNVPWQDIGSLWIETACAGDHPGQMVVLVVRSDSSFRDAARQSTFMRQVLTAEKPPGYRPVPMGTQGIDPQVTLDSLEALRALS